jgi:hypothetical protein
MTAIPQVDLVLPTVPPGISYPQCRATGFQTSWRILSDGTRHARLECAACLRFVRWPRQDPQPEHKYEPRRPDVRGAALQPPPDRWHWLGFIRQADGLWKPVAMAETLGRCWEALLTYPYEGDLLAVPVEPVRRKGATT